MSMEILIDNAGEVCAEGIDAVRAEARGHARETLPSIPRGNLRGAVRLRT